MDFKMTSLLSLFHVVLGNCSTPGNKENFSWGGTNLFLSHQETKRISWSPGGLKKSVVPHQEKISWSPGGWIHQETKKISCNLNETENNWICLLAAYTRQGQTLESLKMGCGFNKMVNDWSCLLAAHTQHRQTLESFRNGLWIWKRQKTTGHVY